MKQNEENSIQIYCPIELYRIGLGEIEDKFNGHSVKEEWFEKLRVLTISFSNVNDKTVFCNYVSNVDQYPPWVCFPNRETISIFFRQGIGQAYVAHWFSLAKSISAERLNNILEEFPPNADWKEYLDIKLA